MALRDSMRSSAAQYLNPGEPIQAVIGAQTASQWLAALTGVFMFLGLNHYRILAVTPTRIVVLDAGKASMTKARGVVTELPRSTRLGPAPASGTRSRPARRRCGCTAGSSRTSRPPTASPPPPDAGPNGERGHQMSKPTSRTVRRLAAASVAAAALTLAGLTPALAATGPSMTANHGGVNISVPGPHNSLRFYWANNGSATWHAEKVAARARRSRRRR